MLFTAMMLHCGCRLSSSSVGGVSRTYSGSAKHVLSSAPSRTLSLAGPLPYEDVLIDGFDVPKVHLQSPLCCPPRHIYNNQLKIPSTC